MSACKFAERRYTKIPVLKALLVMYRLKLNVAHKPHKKIMMHVSPKMF